MHQPFVSLAAAAAAVALTASPVMAQSPSATKSKSGSSEAAAAQCQAQVFETTVVVDPATKRTTHIKMCANPGSSDSDWIRTLKDAIVQLDKYPYPPAAKAEMVAQVQAEIARIERKQSALLPSSEVMAPGLLPKDTIPPKQNIQVSTYPDLRAKPRNEKDAKRTGPRVMVAGLQCLAFGRGSKPINCDFFERNTYLSLTAVSGFEDGAKLRFLRRGDPRGEVVLAPLKDGEVITFRIPEELCRRVTRSKVEIEIQPRTGGATLGRLGPYGINC